MRLVTWNLNGIRAAIRKGFDEFIIRMDPDILLLQEVRALPEQLPKDWAPSMEGVIWHPAEKKGYSGVSTWDKSQHLIQEIGRGMPSVIDPDDDEGRILHTLHNTDIGPIHCINIYLPNGGASPERQAYKEEWLEDLLLWAQKWAESGEAVVLCGDLNIAHEENDIWNPSGNRRTSGFLIQEREWFSRFLNSGWNDLHRMHFGDIKGPYTWWSNRGQAREKNRGWRIDYVLANDVAAEYVQHVEVLRQGGLIVSDHAPLIVDFSLEKNVEVNL